MRLHRVRSLVDDVDATSLLIASTVGTYLLILAGVSNALANTRGVCGTWPMCAGPWLSSPALLVVFAHRLAAALVAVILVATVVRVRRDSARRGVRVSVLVATALYPFEVVLGARTAVSGTSGPMAIVHLAVAMVIFTALMAALSLELDGETAAAPSSNRDGDLLSAPSSDGPGSADGLESPSGEPPSAAQSGAGYRERVAPGGGEPVIRSVVTAYVKLTKPYLWWLLCLVALAGMGLAAGGVPPLVTTVATLSGGILAIGASATFNNVYERDRDKKMRRTEDRPTATAEVKPTRALAFGVALTVASMGVFLTFVNLLAAALAFLAIVYYTVVYTMVLKPTTSLNTVIGGAVGAFPALIGWAAVTDSVGVPALVLGLVIFLWTPAHFYNLALLYREDYARAGFPMLPVVRGEQVARRHVVEYLGATMLAAIVLGTVTSLGRLYAGAALVLGTVFLLAVVRLNREHTDAAAKRAFVASNLYLGVLLVAVVLDTMAV